MRKNIDTLYQDALDVVNELNIEVGKIISVRWNNRLKSVWGRCTRSNYKRNNGVVEWYYSIELNSILASDDVSWEDAMNTMIHEVLHAHKDRFCHTGEWKKCAELINREYPIYHITRCTSAEEKNVADKVAPTFHYIVKCNKCNSEYKYQRAGRVVKALQRNPHSCTCYCGSKDFSLIYC